MNRLDDTLGYLTARTAVATLVSVLLFGLLAYVVQLLVDGRVRGLAADALVTVVLLVAAAAVITAVGRLLTWLERSGPLSPHQRELSYRFVQLLTVGGAVLIVGLYVWQITLANVLLGAGVTSVVLAVAARQTLSSVLSGIVIMSTDVFRVGDWVRIDDRFGRIERISFFNTEVRSPQGETHVFPNDDLAARDITNLGNQRYRNDVLVGVDYETDIEHAIDVCDGLLEELTAADGNPVDGFHPTTVKEFDDSQITLAVKMWVARPTPQAINQAQTVVLAQVHRRFEAERIAIPFPQRTVSDRVPA